MFPSRSDCLGRGSLIVKAGPRDMKPRLPKKHWLTQLLLMTKDDDLNLTSIGRTLRGNVLLAPGVLMASRQKSVPRIYVTRDSYLRRMSDIGAIFQATVADQKETKSRLPTKGEIERVSRR